MTLLQAIARVYPNCFNARSGRPLAISADGLVIVDWPADLGAKPDEATLLAQAAQLPPSDFEKRPRDARNVYADISALAATDQNKLMRAVCAVWMTQNPAQAKAILAALNIQAVPGDEVAP